MKKIYISMYIYPYSVLGLFTPNSLNVAAYH